MKTTPILSYLLPMLIGILPGYKLKQQVLFILLFFAGTALPAQKDTAIRFEHASTKDILAKAKREKKPVFVDLYATWCGPCKWMEKHSFRNDTAAVFYNTNFINIRIDAETETGKALVKQFDVRCYPTYLFIDGDSTLIHRFSGAIPAAELIRIGKNALDPNTRYQTLKKEYESGTSTPEQIMEYIRHRKSSCLPVDAEIAAYFKSIPEHEYTNKTQWALMRNNPSDPRSFHMQYLISHRVAYESRYTLDSVHRVIEQSYAQALGAYIYKETPDTLRYMKLRGECLELGLLFAESLTQRMDMELFDRLGDWKRFAHTAVRYVDRYGSDDYALLNNTAWSFYEHVDDTALLAKAAGWAKRATELKPTHAVFDTYAAVLYKQGKMPEAKKAAEVAISLARQEGNTNYTATEALLKKIESH